MPAKGGCPAHLDGAHEPVLLERQSILGAVDGAVAAEDIGHLKGGPCHRLVRGCFAFACDGALRRSSSR
jgi:hypothetical protein